MSAVRTPNTFKKRWWIVIAIILTVVAWFFLRAEPANTANPQRSMAALRGAISTPVRATGVRLGRVEERLYAVGTVQAFNTVTVRARVEGELQVIHFKDGQFVRAGELLAQVDPRPFQAKLDQAKGQLKQSQSQLQVAQSDLQRFLTLEKQQSIAKQQVDSQRALVEQLTAAVSSAQAVVADAELQLDYTKITAPISGRLGLRQLDVGNLISAASTNGLVIIAQTQPIAVSFSLPEKDLQRLLERLQLEEQLTVQISDRQAHLISTGLLLAVDNQIDMNTGTVRVKASMPNLDNALFPNQFVSVTVLLAQHKGLVIPSVAIQSGSIGDFVYVKDEDKKVRIQKVTVGLSADDTSLITEGLQLGDKVITEGTDRLRDGSLVEIMSPSAADPEVDNGISP